MNERGKAICKARTLAVRLIGVSSGHGVPAAVSQQSAAAAEALRRADVGQAIRAQGIPCDWESVLSVPAGLLRQHALSVLADQLVARIQEVVASAAPDQRVLPIVLSGDHAVAEGAWRGMAAVCNCQPGLLWIDAHLDAHTLLTTPSGNPHGMPLAALLGCLPNPWNQATAVIAADRSCVFGARSHETGELDLLQGQGVRIYTMAEIRQRGFVTCFAEALARVRSPAHPWGISLDLDAIDPSQAHGVNTPVAGGLDGLELKRALQGLAHDEQFIGFEVSEYNPVRDADGLSALWVQDLLAALVMTEIQTPSC